MAWPKDMPIAEVFWSDSAATPGWHDQETLDGGLELPGAWCVSVGFLYADTPDQVALLQSVNNTGGYGEMIQIPRHAVQHLRVLAEPI